MGTHASRPRSVPLPYVFCGVARVTRRGSLVREMGGGGPSPDCRFQLASVSEQITAAAVLLLVDDGKLATSDRITRWIENCPPTWNGITLHRPLTHTAGLPHWGDLPQIVLTEWIEPYAELAVFREAPLRSRPGENWYYSSPGYVVPAHVVQRASGVPYREFLRRRIFEPLELAQTFAGNADGRPHVAPGHSGGVPVKSFELETTGMGAGDIWSTIDDVLRWDAALFESGFLDVPSRAAMLARHVELPEPAYLEEGSAIEGNAYGYGWFLGGYSGEHLIAHPGDNAGFKALNLIVPSRGVRLVMLVNDEESELARPAEELLTAAS